MSSFTKISLWICLIGLLVLPTLATRLGIGLPTERSPKVVKEMQRSCPAAYKRPDGTCNETHRSHYRRSYLGGARRGGK